MDTTEALKSAPFKAETLSAMRSIWTLVDTSHLVATAWDPSTAFARHNHMLLISSLSSWLDLCRSSVISWLRSNLAPSDWTHKLARDVSTVYSLGLASRTFDRIAYIPHLEESIVYTLRPRGRYTSICKEEGEERIAQTVLDILSSWFQMRRLATVQGTFITILLEFFPPSILTLECTWTAFNQVAAKVFNARRLCAALSYEDFAALREHIAVHPIFDPCSEDRKIFMWGWTALHNRRFLSTPLEIQDLTHVLGRYPVHSLLLYLRELDLARTSLPGSRWRTSPCDSSGTSPIPPLFPFGIASPGSHTSSGLESNGGLFSLLLSESTGYETLPYDDFASWQTYLSFHPPPTTPDRIDFAQSIWEVIENSDPWDRLTAGGPVPFPIGWAYIKRFPTLPPLACWLVLEELVLGGVVSEPCSRDVGLMIEETDGKAAELLQWMQEAAVEGGVSVKGTVDQIFQDVFDNVTLLGTDLECSRWRFNTFMLERAAAACRDAVVNGLYSL